MPQQNLDFDGPALDKHEKRLLIRAVTFERVRLELTSATRAKWRNGQEVLQYFVSLDRCQTTTPSIAAIAKGTGMSASSVKQTVAFLVSLGVLIRIDRGRKTNEYRIDFRRLAVVGSKVSDKRSNLVPQTAENCPTKFTSKELTSLTSQTKGTNSSGIAHARKSGFDQRRRGF